MFWFRLSAQKQEENQNGQSQSNCFSLSHYGKIANIEFYVVGGFFIRLSLCVLIRIHSLTHALTHSTSAYYFALTMDKDRHEEMKNKKKTRHTIVMHVPLIQCADNVSFHTYYTTIQVRIVCISLYLHTTIHDRHSLDRSLARIYVHLCTYAYTDTHDEL